MRIRARYVVTLVIIVVAVLAAPLIDGFFFQQNYKKMIDARNANGAQITIAEYHLGWLTSTAKLEINSGQNPQTNITVDQVITHGPIVKDPTTDEHKLAEATIVSHVHLNKKAENFLLNGNTANGVMGIFTWVTFLQHYKSHFQSASFVIKTPGQNEGKVTWAGVSGDVETDFKHDYALENFKITMTSSPLYIQSLDHYVQLSAQQLVGEGNCGKEMMCVGNSMLSIPLITVSSNTQNIRIGGFSYAINSELDDKNNFTGGLTLLLGKYDAQDFNITGLGLKINVKSINAEALKKIVMAMHDASENMEKSQQDPHATQLMLLAQLAAEAPHLVTSNFSVTETFAMGSSYGMLNSNAVLSWPAKTPLPNTLSDLMQVTFKMHVQAATALVDQTIAYMDQKAQEAQATAAMPTPVTSDSQSPNATATGGKAPQSFDEVIAPLLTQGLSQDEEKNILSLQQKNVSPDDFNSYIDSRVAIRMIPAAVGPVLKKDYQNVLNNPFLNVAANAGANKELDVWVRENKITSETRQALILLQKQGFPPEIYNASIDDIVNDKRMPADLGAQLKTQYDSANQDTTLGGVDETASATATNTAAQDQGENRKKFDAEVQQGFIVQDKDTYRIDIDYEHGELKLNGKAVPLPSFT